MVAQLYEEVSRLSRTIANKPDWPAGLTTGQAIMYTGLTSKQFGALVKAGLIKPCVAPGSPRRVYRRVDLDAALARLVITNDPAMDMDFGED